MSLPGLTQRDTVVRELMDDPDCDLTALQHTYEQFRVLNRVLAGWRGIYVRLIRPLLEPDRVATLLDIGCGGGDVARSLARWAAGDGLRLDITAVDPDERAYAFATAQPPVGGVTFRQASSADLVAEGAVFDVVVSNHLLHHLDPATLTGLLSDSERLSRQLVVHNDLARSRRAYGAYAVVSRPFGRRSFVHVDGLLSIRRSYRRAELAAVVGPSWRVVGRFPARLLLMAGSGTMPVVKARNLGRGEHSTRDVGGVGAEARDRRPAFLFTAASISYVANCALGAAVATRLVDTRRAHWVHHALYTCTSTLAGAAVSSLVWSSSRAGWWLLPAAVPLGLIPRVSARTPTHVGLAVSAAPFFVAGLVKAWR